MPAMHVEKSIGIDAPPQAVFDVVSDFSTWTTWSPWLCAEPDAKVTVSDDPRSVGSTYRWEGNLTGAGEIEHQRIERARLVDMQLTFLKPWKSVNRTAFLLESAGQGTRLTWTMDASLPWFLFWMRATMETLIGMDYDRGLRMIKQLVEQGRIDSKVENKGVVDIGPVHVAGVRRSCAFDEIGPSMQQAMADAASRLAAAGIDTSGELVSVYHRLDIKRQRFDYTAGYVLDRPVSGSAEIDVWNLPRGRALRVDHTGDYHHLGNAWSAAQQFARYNKLKPCKQGAFELYKNDPRQSPPSEWLTEVYLPLR